MEGFGGGRPYLRVVVQRLARLPRRARHARRDAAGIARKVPGLVPLARRVGDPRVVRVTASSFIDMATTLARTMRDFG